MGRRLGELTKGNTKCMVEVNGTTLIERTLNQLQKLHLSRLVMVVGYQSRNLIDFLGTDYNGLKIEYVHNPIYDKTNNIYSLALAKRQLQEDDTLLLESDLIFDPQMLEMLLSDPRPNLALVAKYESWMDGTMVRIDEDDNIVNFVPKSAFNYRETSGYYKTVNIYKFSKEFSTTKYVPFLEAYSKVVGNNEYYENVLRIITFLNSHDLKALRVGDLNGTRLTTSRIWTLPRRCLPTRRTFCASFMDVLAAIGAFRRCLTIAIWSILISLRNEWLMKCRRISKRSLLNTRRE